MKRVALALVVAVAVLAASVSAAVPPKREEWRSLVHVKTDRGRNIDLAATFFRYAVASSRDGSAWSTTAIDPASVAIVDEDNHRMYGATAVQREALGLAHMRSGRLDVAVGRLSMRTVTTHDRQQHVALHVEAGAASADLDERVDLPLIVLADGATAYPRLAVRGTVLIGNESLAVHGTGWIDHAVGGARADGWDRFVVAFDDGRVLLVERRRRASGVRMNVSGGVYLDRSGIVHRLGAGDFFIENPLATSWLSIRTHARYPAIWEISVPSAGLDLAVIPPVQDQEIVSDGQGQSFYDGAVTVERFPPPEHTDIGRGFVELTGYVP
jgi:predicted secreted hydrolase